uniref:RNA polymerase subunit alpha n=1 Tax=Prototheca tumulicola TaxID=1737639 RepID=UPI003002C2BA
MLKYFTFYQKEHVDSAVLPVMRFEFHIGYFRQGEGTAFAAYLRICMLSLDFMKEFIYTYNVELVNFELTSLIVNSKTEKNDNILHNLQGAIFLSLFDISSENPIFIRMRTKGPQMVFLYDLELPTGIVCLNPNKFLFEIYKGEEITFSFNLISIKTKEENPSHETLNSINLDFIKTPITDISFTIDEFHINSNETHERIRFFITTHQEYYVTILPQQLLQLALYHMAKKVIILLKICSHYAIDNPEYAKPHKNKAGNSALKL